jgi:hypothetical protein
MSDVWDNFLRRVHTIKMCNYKKSPLCIKVLIFTMEFKLRGMSLSRGKIAKSLRESIMKYINPTKMLTS